MDSQRRSSAEDGGESSDGECGLVRTTTARNESRLDDESDDEDSSTLQRTSTVAQGGRSAILPSEAAGLSGAPPGLGFRVKNTFIHVDDDLSRVDSSGPLGRTKSDPSGGRSAQPPRTPKMVPGISAVLEEVPGELRPGESSEDEGDGKDLEKVDTWDHFNQGMYEQLQADALQGGYPAAGGMQPYMLPQMYAMMPAFPDTPWPVDGMAQEQGKDQAAEALAAGGPPFGFLHTFHKEVRGFGLASPDLRQFTKGEDYEGRLSVLSGSEVQKGGQQRYLMQFSGGILTKADGIGFVFASRVPCAKNIQKIVSVFVNQSGRICMRVFGDILRAKKHVRALRIGDWIEMAIDLEDSIATFNIWPCDLSTSEPDSAAVFHYGKRLAQANQSSSKPVKLNVGHFACVIQNVGVTVTMGS